MSHAAIKVRPIRPEDEPAVQELHRRYYWRSHCLLLNADFYRWQFALPPDSAAAGGDQSLVAVGDGTLLSYLGVVPAGARCCGRPVRAAHLISWLSAPEARGQGLGRTMMGHLTERYDFLFGRSVTPAALAIYRRLAFRYFGHCSRWLAVLDPAAALSLAVAPSPETERRAHARAVAPSRPADVCLGTRAPPGAATLAESVLASSVSFARSAAYLSWRYEQHPVFRYRFLWLGAAPEALAVVRVEEVAGRPGRVLRVVEFLATPHAARRLGEAVLAYGREQGCAFADAFGMSERFVAGFVAAGGFEAREEPELRLPHLLQPWDTQVEPPGLLFFGRRPAGAAGDIGLADDVSRIHVSRGDGNMDWPSWSPAAGLAPATGPNRHAA
jgi:hypothetical protein